jgi:hypothetical protein
MINPETGAPHTAHTTNKVPFIIAGVGGKEWTFEEEKKVGEEQEEGALCDVAPTVLHILVSMVSRFPSFRSDFFSTGRRKARRLVLFEAATNACIDPNLPPSDMSGRSLLKSG